MNRCPSQNEIISMKLRSLDHVCLLFLHHFIVIHALRPNFITRKTFQNATANLQHMSVSVSDNF